MTLSLGLVILNGGRSSRMKRDKGSLPWAGGTLLSRIITASQSLPFAEIIVSANTPPDLSKVPSSLCQRIRIVADAVEGCGPLGGIASALRTGSCQFYAVVSVDLPFYDFSPIRDWLPLLTSSSPPAAIVPTADGHDHPLAAVYSRTVLPRAEQALRRRMYRVRAIYEGTAVHQPDESKRSLLYMNTNTPADYADALAIEANLHRAVPIVTISAPRSNSGKTVLAVKLIASLRQRGYAVAYVKSSHHAYDPGKAGSDTGRAKKAGASRVFFCSDNDVPPGQHKKDMLLQLTQQSGADIAMIESRRHGIGPIIEVRRCGEAEPYQNSAAVVSETEPLHYSGRWFRPEETDELCAYVLLLTHPRRHRRL